MPVNPAQTLRFDTPGHAKLNTCPELVKHFVGRAAVFV
jgi:hypothetical protein